jgi:hypothetical protein
MTAMWAFGLVHTEKRRVPSALKAVSCIELGAAEQDYLDDQPVQCRSAAG